MKIYEIKIEVEDHIQKLYEYEIANAIQKVVQLAKHNIKVSYKTSTK